MRCKKSFTSSAPSGLAGTVILLVVPLQKGKETSTLGDGRNSWRGGGGIREGLSRGREEEEREAERRDKTPGRVRAMAMVQSASVCYSLRRVVLRPVEIK